MLTRLTRLARLAHQPAALSWPLRHLDGRAGG